jgi:hypothetical protein
MNELTTSIEKRPRKKRRVEGSATPPRVSFTVRMEQKDYDAFVEFLKTYSGSQNDYICYMLNSVVKHASLFKSS